MSSKQPESPRLPTREGDDRRSETYDGDVNPLIATEQPRIDEAVGDVRGPEILELGCGTGWHALRPAEAGARVTALGFHEGMLARAIRKSEHAGDAALAANDPRLVPEIGRPVLLMMTLEPRESRL